MKTPLKYIIFAIICLIGSFAGGLLSVQLYLQHVSVGLSEVVRAKRIELLDSQGRTRGLLASDQNNVFLKLFSPEGKPEISASVPNTSDNSQTNNPGIRPGELSPTMPQFIMADGAGKGEVRIEVNRYGEGHVAIGSDPQLDRVLLGRFFIGDVQPDPDRYGGWGLQVLGRRQDGTHLNTGVGIVTSQGIDSAYLFPVNR